MKVANIVIWDLETGGLKAERNAVAEIAMIAINSVTLDEIGRYEAIIAPYKQLDGTPVEYVQKALDYNGLTMRRIEAGKDAKIVAKEIQQFLKQHSIPLRHGNGKPIPAGHNIAKFDIPFLKHFLAIHKIKYGDLFQEWPLDTLWMTRLRWPQDGDILNHQLGTACEKAGIELIDAHRAINDVEANTELLRYFLKSMRSNAVNVQSKTESSFRESFMF